MHSLEFTHGMILEYLTPTEVSRLTRVCKRTYRLDISRLYKHSPRGRRLLCMQAMKSIEGLEVQNSQPRAWPLIKYEMFQYVFTAPVSVPYLKQLHAFGFGVRDLVKCPSLLSNCKIDVGNNISISNPPVIKEFLSWGITWDRLIRCIPV